jgi:hypothetical protein
VKAKENSSWFLKMNWPSNPMSNYQVIIAGFRNSLYEKMVQSITNKIKKELNLPICT